MVSKSNQENPTRQNLEVIKIRDLSEISRGGGGGGNRGRVTTFLRPRKGRDHEKWAVKKGRAMQTYALDHVRGSLTEEKRSFLFGKKKKSNGTLWI